MSDERAVSAQLPAIHFTMPVSPSLISFAPVSSVADSGAAWAEVQGPVLLRFDGSAECAPVTNAATDAGANVRHEP